MTAPDALQIAEAIGEVIDRARDNDVYLVEVFVAGHADVGTPQQRYVGERMTLRKCDAPDCTLAHGAPRWFENAGRSRYCCNACQSRTNMRRYRARKATR